MKNLAVTLLIVLFPLFVFAQDEVSFEIETPIGIEGCSSIADISFSPNSEIIMVACSSTPRGLYYSRDGGATWTFARGGAYQYGSGVSIRMTDTLAFASAGGNGFIVTSLPSSPSEEWTPSWASVGTSIGGVLPFYFEFAGEYLLVSRDTDSGQGVEAYDLNTSSYVDSLSVVLGEDLLQGLRIAYGNGFLYAATRDPDSAFNLYKIPFDTSTGTFGAIADISTATGLPVNGQIQSLAYSDTLGKLFVTAGGSIYVSDDDGATFSTPTLAGGDINYTLKTTGQRILIGNNLSVDGGDTWQQVEDKSVIDEVEQTTSEMIGFHPTNQDLAFISTEVGLAKTDNLTTDFTLSRANSGLSGVKVLELKRAFNSDRALLLTQAGLGFTDDITAETIHWTFPICADGVDCDVIRSAVFHPTDDTKVYLADGSLYRLDLSFSEGEFSASTTEIGNFSNVTQLSTSSLLQTTLVLMRESADDGLTTLSLTDETTTSDLYTDSPVHSFFPLTSTSWVISTGDAHPLSSSARAVLKTVDSGASFQNIVNGDLPTNALVHEFDYDSENDILYAGTSNDRVSEDEDASISSVFVLSAALEGTGSWVDSADKPEDLSNSAPGITRVVHDSENDIVYAVGGIYLFQSTDRGETWEHIFTNTPGFYIEVFDLIRSVVVLSQSRAQEADKLVVGDSSGLNLLSEEDNSGGGEVEPADYSCSFSISSKCLKKRVPRGKTCKVTANLRNEKEDSGERSRFLFQRRKNSSKPWVRILRDRTKKSGKKKNTFTVLKPGEYRVIFPKVSCETVPVEVRTKKKK